MSAGGRTPGVRMTGLTKYFIALFLPVMRARAIRS
jgi:hypothetical protein